MDPYDFGRFFRGIFGFQRGKYEDQLQRGGDDRDIGTPSCEDELRRGGNEGGGNNSFNFNVFSDPLEIHKFFEREMEQMFKDFGGIGGIMGQKKYLEEDFPSRFQELPNNPESDRDLMLKSESERVSPRVGDSKLGLDVQDRDLDNENITSDHLDKLLKSGNRSDDQFKMIPREYHQDDGNPWQGMLGSHQFSFSYSSKSIQKPDGSIQIEERTRNPDGTESIIIKRRIGNEETIIHQEGHPDDGARGYQDQNPNRELAPFHPHQDPFKTFSMMPGFGHFFSGLFGGHEKHQSGPLFGDEGDRRGGGCSPVPPPAPPSDRIYSSLFSQLFGDGRR